MPLKQYVRYTHTQSSFLSHLRSRPYLKGVVTFAWLFMLFALSMNVSVNYFAHRQKTAILASATAPKASVVDGSVQGISSDIQATAPAQVNSSQEDEKDIAEQTAKTPRKASYKIAVFGDSMIDSFGTRMSALENSLKKKYPNTVFVFYNYGVGAENVETGLARFDSPFVKGDRSYPALSKLGPDIIILGSYAYNPFVPYDRDKHWLQLAKLIEKAKTTNADVYLLAENAPLRMDFARGPQGLNFDSVTAYEKSGEVIQQLENAIGLSKNLNVILINAFEKSLASPRGDGKREYVSYLDGIHPSEAGQNFIADQVAETLVLD